MNDLSTLTIAEAGKKMRAGEITAVDVARACLVHCETKNKELNVYLEVFDDVIAQAEAADAKRGRAIRSSASRLPSKTIS